MGGDALQHPGEGDLGSDSIRDRDQRLGIGSDPLGVTVRDARPDYATACSGDRARALDAHDRGWCSNVLAAFALVNVAEVDSDRLHVDQHLAIGRSRVRHILEAQDIGSAVALVHDGLQWTLLT